jgi:hypothetical protein
MACDASAPSQRLVVSRSSEPGVPVMCPRLMTVKSTGQYLGVTVWRVRGLIHAGVLKPVRIPLGNGAEERKHLLDRRDLDELIERWKA